MSRDCLADDQKREVEYVPSTQLRLAAKAWQAWEPRAMAEKDAEIDALRTELRRIQAELEAARIRLGELPRRRTGLKVARQATKAAGGRA